jgi:very-short-patch-repair endonuclease
MTKEPLRLLPDASLPEWMEESAEYQESVRREREDWTGRRSSGWTRIGDALAQLVAHDYRPPRRRGRSRADKEAYADHLRQNMTLAEQELWVWLQGFELDFEPQVVVAGWIVDFFSANLGLVVEVDGSAHRPSHRAQQDLEREQSIESKGFRVVRLTNHEVMARQFDRLLLAIGGDLSA